MQVAELDLESRVTGDVATVLIRGEIDVATAPQLRELLHELVQDGAKQIVLDCHALGFLDSSGIGLLVATRKRLGDDGQLVIESPPSHVRKVLELTGVTQELSLRP
jgi:anti-sigma B factor antagonist